MKRILSLDGGGIRGMLSLQVLGRIESLFAEARNRPDLVLADEFDLFAGTSTGAIIATGLSWGLKVSELERMYLEHGPAMFAPTQWWQRWRSKYRADSIARFFCEFFSETDGSVSTLGTSRLQRLLLIVMRNASTGAPWPVTNNPLAKFNDRNLANCNLNVPLWQLLRASTAAPGYFPPQEICLGNRTDLFIDGGITSYNNPALLAVLLATLRPYRLEWPVGVDSLHVVSVGTGSVRTRLAKRYAVKVNLLDQLGHMVPALISSAVKEQDMLCRVLGDCLHGTAIDSELGDLIGGSPLSQHERLFSYARYDLALDEGEVLLSAAETKLDNVALLPLLREVGREYAERHVRASHLLLGQSA